MPTCTEKPAWKTAPKELETTLDIVAVLAPCSTDEIRDRHRVQPLRGHHNVSETRTRLWSASQASVYLDCPRKWAFRYYEKRRAPETQSLQIGSAVHAVLEATLKRLPPARDMSPELVPVVFGTAGAIAKNLPRGRILGIEKPRQWGNWRGTIDLEYQADPYAVGVADHKTRKRLSRYIPTSEELAEDVQATIYTFLVAHAYNLEPDDIVPLWWTFGQTTPPHKAQAVRSALRVSTACERVELLDKTVVEPGNRLLQTITSAHDVEPNPRACHKYGGCPHREYCNLTDTDKLKTFLGESDMSTLWARLQNQTGGIGGPAEGVNAQAPAPAQTAPAPAQTAPPPAPVLPPAQAIPVPPAPVPPPVQTYAQPPAPVPPPVQAAPVPPAQAYAPPPAAQPPAASVPPAPVQESAGTGYLLLIDCVTDGAVLVSGLVHTAHERLKADAGIPHWRVLEWGKGPGALCEYVREELAQVEPGAVLQVSTGADETGAILGMLETGAVQIIRGTR